MEISRPVEMFLAATIWMAMRFFKFVTGVIVVFVGVWLSGRIGWILFPHLMVKHLDGFMYGTYAACIVGTTWLFWEPANMDVKDLAARRKYYKALRLEFLVTTYITMPALRIAIKVVPVWLLLTAVNAAGGFLFPHLMVSHHDALTFWKNAILIVTLLYALKNAWPYQEEWTALEIARSDYHRSWVHRHYPSLR